MIAAEKEPCWIVTCDECDLTELDSEGTTHYVSETEARERALDLQWRELPEGRLWLCSSCAEEHGWP